MKNIVIIPCFNRPEFLGACLTLIQRADNWNDNHYLFAVEYKALPENKTLIEQFPGEKTVIDFHRRYHGNSANLMGAYTRAYNMGAPLVSLIEEDIFIGKDFFNFHESIQSQLDYFFVSGCLNQNDRKQVGENVAGVFTHFRYQSLGVSFTRNNLAKIIPHDNDEFYKNRGRYLMKLFPNSHFREQQSEQDGLINRIMEADGLIGIYPEVPRSFHAGFYGYNRPGIKVNEKNLTLQDKIKLLLEMPEPEMNKRAIRMKDIVRCDLETSHRVDKFIINNDFRN